MLNYIRDWYYEDIKIKKNVICKICNKIHGYGTQLMYCPMKHEYCLKCIDDEKILCSVCNFLLKN